MNIPFFALNGNNYLLHRTTWDTGFGHFKILKTHDTPLYLDTVDNLYNI